MITKFCIYVLYLQEVKKTRIMSDKVKLKSGNVLYVGFRLNKCQLQCVGYAIVNIITRMTTSRKAKL